MAVLVVIVAHYFAVKYLWTHLAEVCKQYFVVELLYAWMDVKVSGVESALYG